MRHTTRARVTGLACAAVMLCAAVPAQADSGRPELGDVQKALDVLAKTPGVVGAIGEVYVNGRRAGGGSAGSRLIDGKGGRIPPGARFRIGSQTKSMTATVVLQMVKEGRIGLEDTLADVLPEVVQGDLVERAGEITVRQLIRHTSGIPEYFSTDVIDIFDTTTYYSPADLVKMTRDRPRTGEPGEKFSYSSTNYTLLGMIIERLAGRPLGAEFGRRLFGPLGMSRTYLPVKPPEGIRGPHGHGYLPGPDGKPRDMDRLNASYGYAGGGVVSTARDMSAFRSAFVRGKLLPPSLQRVMTDPPEGAPPPPPPLCGGSLALPSNGGAPGFTSATFTTPDGRSQLAVSTTVDVAQSITLLKAINQAAEAVFCPKPG